MLTHEDIESVLKCFVGNTTVHECLGPKDVIMMFPEPVAVDDLQGLATALLEYEQLVNDQADDIIGAGGDDNNELPSRKTEFKEMMTDTVSGLRKLGLDVSI
jgi:hypothetical protein